MLFRRIVIDKITSTWMILTMSLILMLPLLIGTGLYMKALPMFGQQGFLHLIGTAEWSPSQGKFGFWPFIASSLYVTIISFLMSAPVCLLAAIYLTQFSSVRLVRIMHPIIDILAGLPSVIYGVWGILVIVPFVSNLLAPVFKINSTGYSILSGGIVLAVMCIPYMLNMIIEVFNTVPVGLKEAALSLGATLWESVKHVVVKKSFPGIISAYGLGLAKAFGETIAVMMVVGNRVQVTSNPFEAGYPLPALIANNYGEMLSIPQYDSALMFAALLLLLIILTINLLFRYFIYKTREQ
ncbi:MAG: phosphate ABC transporter permease subunit PstC [Bacteroidetes bacterium]|nr:phosphate ABC transporter permease subunit PstC [Bacteroidota bacterium]